MALKALHAALKFIQGGRGQLQPFRPEFLGRRGRNRGCRDALVRPAMADRTLDGFGGLPGSFRGFGPCSLSHTLEEAQTYGLDQRYQMRR